MGPNVSAPGSHCVPITPSDTTDLPGGVCRSVKCQTAGVARVIYANGTDSGSANCFFFVGYNPIAIKRVYSTGLVAGGLEAVY